MGYTPTIGLEIHIELKTKSKMFCSCLNDPLERHANVNVCPVCLGHPGVLPVINQEAIRKVIKTGLALNGQIPEHSRFDRKNYFYPDLPKGYQISQLYLPFCKNGYLDIRFPDIYLGNRISQNYRKIRIREIHLEEDTGKLIHPEGADYSLVDFNRAGVPLMELVTEPDLSSAKETRQFAEELQLILRYLDVAEADMEKGQMRIEVNISLSQKSKVKSQKLGTKVEIKNLNSFRSVERGIDYEIERQAKILKSGKKVVQETRGWHDFKEITFSQRVKEEARDYRYFPEPDLPPLHFSKKEIAEIRGTIPELPQSRRKRFKKEYQIGEKEIELFTQHKDLGEYFEKVVSELPPNLPQENLFKLIKLSSNYLITDLQGLLRGASVTSEDFLITPENFAQFINLIFEGKISSKIAKMVLEEMFETGGDPSNIIKEKGLIQISDEAQIEKIIKEVISQNTKTIEDYKKGKENTFQYLIGQIMARTKGKANPQLVNKLLKQTLTKTK